MKNQQIDLINTPIVITDEWGSRTITSQAGSQTITHYTNIMEFESSKIGCFAETTNELADVYNKDGVTHEPTLDRPCDAICKVRPSNTLNSKIIGIIADDHTIISHGDCLCVLIHDPSALYEVGDILTVDVSGLCRKANEQDKLYMLMNRVPMPKITILFPGKEFVGCFIG
jgi:hypothetical protein